jgi:hypothetical protein
MRFITILLVIIVIGSSLTLSPRIAKLEPQILNNQQIYHLPHQPVINSNSIFVIDSSAIAYAMWTQMQENLACNPTVSGLLFICNSFTSYLRRLPHPILNGGSEGASFRIQF